MTMNVWIDDPNHRPGADAAAQTPDEEALLLMSMALDGLLSGAEKARLDTLIAEQPVVAATWSQWQKVDTLLVDAPHVLPAAGFVERFETRLALAERRRAVWHNLAYAFSAMVVWGSIALVLVGVGVLLFVNQGAVASSIAHQLALYPATLWTWLRAVQSTMAAMVRTPETLALMVGYMAATAGLMVWWVRLLQRTTHVAVAATAADLMA